QTFQSFQIFETRTRHEAHEVPSIVVRRFWEPMQLSLNLLTSCSSRPFENTTVQGFGQSYYDSSITSFQHGVLESIYESFVKVAVKFLLSTPKMLLSKPTPVIHNSYPLLSDSSIRRLERQNIIPQRCRNQWTGLDGPMDSARLALRGQHRFP